MRPYVFILTGIMAGIYFSILDGLEQDYGFNHHFSSAVILTILTIITGYFIYKIGRRKKGCMKSLFIIHKKYLKRG